MAVVKNRTTGNVPVNTGHIQMMHQGTLLGPGVVYVNEEVAADLHEAVERHNDAEGRMEKDKVNSHVDSLVADPRIASLAATNESNYAAVQAEQRASNAERALAELKLKAAAAGVDLDATESEVPPTVRENTPPNL